MHREKPHKLLQVGVTPTPATNFLGKRSGCWSVKPVSQKKVGSDEWSITTASHHFGLVAQLAERPVVCGRVEGATPFESAIFRNVAQSLERPAWDREAAGGLRFAKRSTQLRAPIL